MEFCSSSRESERSKKKNVVRSDWCGGENGVRPVKSGLQASQSIFLDQIDIN